MASYPALCPIARTAGRESTSGRVEPIMGATHGLQHSSLNSAWAAKGLNHLRRNVRVVNCRFRRGPVNVVAAIAPPSLLGELGRGKNGTVNEQDSLSLEKLDFFYTEKGQREWVSFS